jgi:transcriptional regulator with XRE-family HTH domain
MLAVAAKKPKTPRLLRDPTTLVGRLVDGLVRVVEDEGTESYRGLSVKAGLSPAVAAQIVKGTIVQPTAEVVEKLARAANIDLGIVPTRIVVPDDPASEAIAMIELRAQASKDPRALRAVEALRMRFKSGRPFTTSEEVTAAYQRMLRIDRSLDDDPSFGDQLEAELTPRGKK